MESRPRSGREFPRVFRLIPHPPYPERGYVTPTHDIDQATIFLSMIVRFEAPIVEHLTIWGTDDVRVHLSLRNSTE